MSEQQLHYLDSLVVGVHLKDALVVIIVMIAMIVTAADTIVVLDLVHLAVHAVQKAILVHRKSHDALVADPNLPHANFLVHWTFFF